MEDKMMVMAHWLNNFWDQCDERQKKEICYGIINYGIYGEEYRSDDMLSAVALNFIVPQITNMQTGYADMVENSKKAGRKPNARNRQIWELARQGKTAAEIGSILGINPKTIYSTHGWAARNQVTFDSENSENNFQNSENVIKNSEISENNSQKSFNF